MPLLRRKSIFLLCLTVLSLVLTSTSSEAKLARKKLDYYANIAITSSGMGRGLDDVLPVIIRKVSPKNEKELKQLKAFEYFDGENYFWKKRGNVHHLYMRKPGQRSKRLEVFVARIPPQSMMKVQMRLMKADPLRYQQYNLDENLEILAIMGVSTDGPRQVIEFVEGKTITPRNGEVREVIIKNADAMLMRFARKYGMTGVDLTLTETEEQSLGGFDKMMQVFNEQKTLDKVFRGAKYTDIYKKIGGISIPGDFQIRLEYRPWIPKGDDRYGAPKAMFYPVPREKDGQSYYPLYVFPGAFINRPILESVVERELYHAQWWNAVANLPADLDKDWRQKSEQAYLREALLRTTLPLLEYDIFLKTRKSVTDTIGKDDAQVYFSYRTLMYQHLRMMLQDEKHVEEVQSLPWTVYTPAILPSMLTRKQQIQQNWEKNWELFGKFFGRDVKNLFDAGDVHYSKALLPADIQKAVTKKDYQEETKGLAANAPGGIISRLHFKGAEAKLQYQQKTVARHMGMAFAQGYEKKREARNMRFTLCLYSLDRNLHEKLQSDGMDQPIEDGWVSTENSLIRSLAETGYSYDDVYWLWDLFNRDGSNVRGMFSALKGEELYANLQMIVDDAEAAKRGFSARQEAARELFEERIKRRIAAELLEEAGRLIYRNAAAKATRLAEEYRKRKKAVSAIEELRKKQLILRRWDNARTELRLEDLAKRQQFKKFFDALSQRMQADTAEEQWQATRDVIDSLQAAFNLPLSEWLPAGLDADAYLASVMPADGELNFDELDKFTIDTKAIEHLIYQEYLQEQGAAKEEIYEFAHELKERYEKRRNNLESQEAKRAGNELLGKLKTVLGQQKKLADETEQVKEQIAFLDHELQILGNPEAVYLPPVDLPDNLPAGVPEPITDFTVIISDLSGQATDDVSRFAAAFSYGKMLEDLERELAQMLEAKRTDKSEYYAENREIFGERDGYIEAIERHGRYADQASKQQEIIRHAEEKLSSLLAEQKDKRGRPYTGGTVLAKYENYIQDRWAGKGFFAYSRKKKISSWEPFVNSVNIGLETDEEKIRELCNKTRVLHDYAGNRSVPECKEAARRWKQDFRESSAEAAELYNLYADIATAQNADDLIAKCEAGKETIAANTPELHAEGVCIAEEIEDRESNAALAAFYKKVQGSSSVEYVATQCQNLPSELEGRVGDLCEEKLKEAEVKTFLVAKYDEMLALIPSDYKSATDAEKEDQKAELSNLCGDIETYFARQGIEDNDKRFAKRAICGISGSRVKRKDVKNKASAWLSKVENSSPVFGLQKIAEDWLGSNQGELEKWLRANIRGAESWLAKESNKLLPKIAIRMAIEDAKFNYEWQKVLLGVDKSGVERSRQLEAEAVADLKKYIEGHKQIIDSYRQLGADEREIEAALERASITRENFSHFYNEKFSRRHILIEQKQLEKNRLAERLARNRFLEASFDKFADAWVTLISDLSPEAKAELDSLFRGGVITQLIAKVSEAVNDKWCESNVRRRVYSKGAGWEKDAKKASDKIDQSVGTELGETFTTPIYKIMKSCGAALDYTLCRRADLMGTGNQVEWDIEKYDSLADAQKKEMRKKWFKCVFKVGIHVADVTGFTGFLLDQAGCVIDNLSLAVSEMTGVDTSGAAQSAKGKLTEAVAQ